MTDNEHDAPVTATPWDLDTYRKRYDEAVEIAKRERANFQRAQRLATILYDLDRCEHGRHEGDVCGGASGCNGPSKGNTHVRSGDVIGYTIDRRPIVMPERSRRHDPDAWVPDQGERLAAESAEQHGLPSEATVIAALRMAEHVISGKPYWSVPTFMRETMTPEQKTELMAWIKANGFEWLMPTHND